MELGGFIIDYLSHFNLALGLELSCHSQDLILELQKFAEIGLQLWVFFQTIDGGLTGRTGQEVESNAQGAPFVLEEIANTLSMENVPAIK